MPGDPGRPDHLLERLGLCVVPLCARGHVALPLNGLRRDLLALLGRHPVRRTVRDKPPLHVVDRAGHELLHRALAFTGDGDRRGVEAQRFAPAGLDLDLRMPAGAG